MFDASTVAKRSGAVSERPATKKSALPLTKRAMNRPMATSVTE
jgi:hypothetical protein